MAEQSQMQTFAGKSVRPPAYKTAVNALTPKEILIMLRQHIWLIILLTFAGLVAGGLSWYLFKRYLPKYTATAYIEVLSPVIKDPTRIGEAASDRENRYVYRMSLATLIGQQGMLNILLQSEKIKQTKWFTRFGASGSEKTTGRGIEKGLKDLQKNMVASADRERDFILVSMTCVGYDEGVKESALIANEMVNLFLKSRGEKEKGDVRQKVQALREQREAVMQELSTYQTTLNNIMTTTGFTDLGEHSYQDVFTQRVVLLEEESSTLMLDMSDTMAQIKMLERQASGPIEEMTSRIIETDPVVAMLNQQTVMLNVALASGLIKYGENHRIVLQLQEQLDEINSQKQTRTMEIGEIIRQSNLRSGQDVLDMLKAKLAQLQASRKEAEIQKQKIDLAKVQYEETITKREEAQGRLAELKASIEKYDVILNDPETPKVKIAAAAEEPLGVSFPRLEVFLPGGTVLGLLLGLALAFAIEFLNDLVRTARDVARFLHIPLLGVIPDSNEDDQLDGIDPSLALIKSPYSVVGEAYRNFRSNLRLLLPATSKSILVTSGFAGDGKTSVAVNLAVSLAAQGKKILLIDANFWQPKLNVIFPKPNHRQTPVKKQDSAPEENGETNEHVELGLSTVLAGLCGYHEVIRPAGISNCDLVDSGLLPPNPAEMLSSVQMEQFIKHQSERYDYVIVDGPPELLVSDVKSLARIVDGTILVFNAANTKRGTAQRIIAELRQVNANVLGCVLFAVCSMKGGYFKEQYKAYQEYQKAQFVKTAVS
jgi:Mrp family chromosome partitioning ATPase/capsular polysaccharide biosynthesis protein